MNQDKPFCPLAQRAIAVASCVQILTEGGHNIFGISISERDAIVSIDYSPRNKKLRGHACGSTYYKGALYFIYQKDIEGVLVKWLEPHFDAQQAAKKVH